MGITRRKFTLEFRIEAAHRVIDTGRSVREVAREPHRLVISRIHKLISTNCAENTVSRQSFASDRNGLHDYSSHVT